MISIVATFIGHALSGVVLAFVFWLIANSRHRGPHVPTDIDLAALRQNVIDIDAERRSMQRHPSGKAAR